FWYNLQTNPVTEYSNPASRYRTHIYNTLYRRLIDEDNQDDKRIWCIATYPSRLQTYNFFTQTFHFITPFIINIVSAVVLIAKKSRKKLKLQDNVNYKELLKTQAREHKHLFIASVVLVILALLRLIISFL
ncbi:unnamed protein product, partial [Rotaria sp. Silwood2]